MVFSYSCVEKCDPAPSSHSGLAFATICIYRYIVVGVCDRY